MALVMTITDGTTTVTSATDFYVLSFRPGIGQRSQALAQDNHEIEFYGGNSTVSANIAKLHKLINQAMTWQRERTGPRVFVTVNIDGTNTYRSELAEGWFDSTPEMVNYERALGTRKGILTLMRRNWWEGAEAQISLSNDNGTDSLGGLTLYEANDGSGAAPNKVVNWVDITAAKVGGDLPAPVRIEMRAGATLTPTNPALTLAKTPAAHGSNSGFWHETFGTWTGNVDANRTNSDYQSITPGGATQTAIGSDMSTYLEYFDNVGLYSVYAALSCGTSGTYKVTPAIYDTVSNYVYGQPQYLSLTSTWTYHDLGLIRYPNNYHSEGVKASGVLLFEGVSGVNLRIDYLTIARCDARRKYIGVMPAGLGPLLIDDGIDDLNAYRTTTLGKFSADYPAYGEQIMLQPGRNHRIHLTAEPGAGVNPRMACVMWVHYRPRYLSL